MKSEIEKYTDVNTYPCLKIYTDKHSNEYNYIVLFYGKNNGVVVWAGNKAIFNVGKNTDYWDETQFNNFYGKLTLWNE